MAIEQSFRRLFLRHIHLRRASRGTRGNRGRHPDGPLIHTACYDNVLARLRLERDFEMCDALLSRSRRDQRGNGEIDQQRTQDSVGAFVRESQGRFVPLRRMQASALAGRRAA
jgi:hypothetical protein